MVLVRGTPVACVSAARSFCLSAIAACNCGQPLLMIIQTRSQSTPVSHWRFTLCGDSDTSKDFMPANLIDIPTLPWHSITRKVMASA